MNGLDIRPFVNASLDAAPYPTSWLRGDLNFDGGSDMTEVSLFVEALLGTQACPQ